MLFLFFSTKLLTVLNKMYNVFSTREIGVLKVVNLMLTARQMLIFKCIVEEFIENAEPVGSKALMVKYQLPYSSATIRNEMNFLEIMAI